MCAVVYNRYDVHEMCNKNTPTPQKKTMLIEMAAEGCGCAFQFGCAFDNLSGSCAELNRERCLGYSNRLWLRGVLSRRRIRCCRSLQALDSLFAMLCAAFVAY